MIGQTNKGQQILRVLESRPYGTFASELAEQVNLPNASVRRWIGTLRAQGHSIVTDGYNGYKLVAPVIQADNGFTASL